MDDVFKAVWMLTRGFMLYVYVYLAAFFLGFVFNNRGAFMTVTDAAIAELRALAREAEAHANENEA